MHHSGKMPSRKQTKPPSNSSRIFGGLDGVMVRREFCQRSSSSGKPFLDRGAALFRISNPTNRTELSRFPSLSGGTLGGKVFLATRTKISRQEGPRPIN